MRKWISAPRSRRPTAKGCRETAIALIFADDQYPVWPLTPEQKAYASIDGARMKRQVIDLAQIAIRYRDAGNKWWGRLPGTTADREGMAYMTRAFESLGLKVEHFPYVLPDDWRPTDWAASYKTADGTTIAADDRVSRRRHQGRPGLEGITAEAVWVGVGAGADFIGRDVKGKAVVIYSTFVPGGRSHSASDRAGLFNANARAVQARRGDGGQRDGRSRQRPVSARRRPARGSAVHAEHGRRLRAERPARQGREGRHELPARRAGAAQRRRPNTRSPRCPACPTSRSS